MKETYTYRTDRLLDEIGNTHGFVNQRNCPREWVGFAIELETELQEATFEIERLRKANLQLREGAEEQRQRIKRLEEAGDMMALHAQLGGIQLDHIGWVNAWREAKEAKP